MPPQAEKTSVPELQRLRIFHTVEERELAAIVAFAEVKRVKSGRYLIQANTEGSDMYVILSGRIKVCQTRPDAKEIILSLQSEGDVVGEIALLTGSRRTADVIALEPLRYLQISRKAFVEHIKVYSGFSMRMLQYLAERVKTSSSQAKEIALYSVADRLLHCLSQLSKPAERNGESLRCVTRCPSHKTLAGLVGASRETITRTFHDLETEGSVIKEGKDVFLTRAT